MLAIIGSMRVTVATTVGVLNDGRVKLRAKGAPRTPCSHQPSPPAPRARLQNGRTLARTFLAPLRPGAACRGLGVGWDIKGLVIRVYGSD